MNTPSQELSEKIMQRLAAEKLILPDDAKRLAEKLANGKMQSSDWRLVVEKVQDKAAQHGKTSTQKING